MLISEGLTLLNSPSGCGGLGGLDEQAIEKLTVKMINIIFM